MSEFGRIPERMHGGLTRWIEQGIPPGDFLQAVIKNDLAEACRRADDENQHLLFDYIKYFYNHAPPQCWGSEKNFKAWVESKKRVRDEEAKTVHGGTPGEGSGRHDGEA